jgi:hypothetical protein
MHMLALLLAVVLVLLAKNGKAEPNMTATYTLGFLAPTADSAMIPASLATEWFVPTPPETLKQLCKFSCALGWIGC